MIVISVTVTSMCLKHDASELHMISATDVTQQYVVSDFKIVDPFTLA